MKLRCAEGTQCTLTVSCRGIVGTLASGDSSGMKGASGFHWASVTSDGYGFRVVCLGILTHPFLFLDGRLTFFYRRFSHVQTVSKTARCFQHRKPALPLLRSPFKRFSPGCWLDSTFEKPCVSICSRLRVHFACIILQDNIARGIVFGHQRWDMIS